MNRLGKRNLLHKSKMIAVCGAMLYLVGGLKGISSEAGQQNLAQVTADIHSVEKANENRMEERMDDLPIVSKKYDDEESYLLAKLAMAEAEGEDTEGKALVISVVLNRVQSDKFPNTIEEVIMQEKQFSVTHEGGRWWTVEPDEDCYNALDMVMLDKWDESYGALYFESEGKSTWHRDNLEYLFKHGNHYFYKEKEE